MSLCLDMRITMSIEISLYTPILSLMSMSPAKIIKMNTSTSIYSIRQLKLINWIYTWIVGNLQILTRFSKWTQEGVIIEWSNDQQGLTIQWLWQINGYLLKDCTLQQWGLTLIRMNTNLLQESKLLGTITTQLS